MGPPMKLGMTLHEHNVIESKLYNKVEDLWLHNPWLEFQRSVTPPIFDIMFKVEELQYVVIFLKPQHIAFLQNCIYISHVTHQE
jgi:hypothetical protein